MKQKNKNKKMKGKRMFFYPNRTSPLLSLLGTVFEDPEATKVRLLSNGRVFCLTE